MLPLAGIIAGAIMCIFWCPANSGVAAEILPDDQALQIHWLPLTMDQEYIKETAELARQFDVDAVSATQKKHLQEHLFSTLLPVQDLPGTECNALLEELQDFVTSILTGRAPQVTGQQGCAAVDVAES